MKDLKTKSWCFCYLVENTHERRFEREFQKIESQKQRQEIFLEKAVDFERKNLLKKYFYNGILKYFYNVQREKQLKVSQSRVKSAVTNFITQLQSQAEQFINSEEHQNNENIMENSQEEVKSENKQIDSENQILSSRNEEKFDSNNGRLEAESLRDIESEGQSQMRKTDGLSTVGKSM